MFLQQPLHLFPPPALRSERVQLVQDHLRHFAGGGLGIVEHALGQRLVRGEQLLDVVFEPELGMYLRPVVSGTNEGEEDHEVLKQRVSEGLPERLQTTRRLRCLQEDVRGAGEDGFLDRRA